MNACAGKRRSHLQEVGESYTEHGAIALAIAWEAFKLTLAMLTHTVLPNVFRAYGSNNIGKLYWFVQLRKKK